MDYVSDDWTGGMTSFPVYNHIYAYLIAHIQACTHTHTHTHTHAIYVSVTALGV